MIEKIKKWWGKLTTAYKTTVIFFRMVWQTIQHICRDIRRITIFLYKFLKSGPVLMILAIYILGGSILFLFMWLKEVTG